MPGPQGKDWGPSTIHGNPRRGTGILNNELYIGKLVWNRLRYLKDPDTGKRVSRPNPGSEWVVQDVPELRIVDQQVWDSVKERLAYEPAAETTTNYMNDRRRPRHLFAGLIKCGCCGGGYSMISKDLLGCSTARNKGTCDNRVNIRRDTLERSVLSGLNTHLMEPDLFREFCAEFTREVNRSRIERGTDIEVWRKELERTERDLDKAIDAILAGVPPLRLKEKIEKLEARKAELTELLANTDEPPPLLHPKIAGIYHGKIATLYTELQSDETRAKAAETFRSLVDRIVLVPEGDKLAIVLRGDLAAILRFVAGRKNPAILSEMAVIDGMLADSSDVRGHRKAKTSAAGALEVSQGSLVAGVGFEPTTFRL